MDGLEIVAKEYHIVLTLNDSLQQILFMIKGALAIIDKRNKA
jgi:hypothetical protein